MSFTDELSNLLVCYSWHAILNICAILNTEIDDEADGVFQTFNCNVCQKLFKTRGALRFNKRKHINLQQYLPAVCVDKKRGIFLVANQKSGLLAPIHVCSHKQKQIQLCSNNDCWS